MFTKRSINLHTKKQQCILTIENPKRRKLSRPDLLSVQPSRKARGRPVQSDVPHLVSLRCHLVPPYLKIAHNRSQVKVKSECVYSQQPAQAAPLQVSTKQPGVEVRKNPQSALRSVCKGSCWLLATQQSVVVRLLPG